MTIIKAALFGLLATVTALGGCTTAAQRLPTRYPSSAIDWNGMDSVDFVKELRLENYSTLLVTVDTSHAALPEKDDNSYMPAAKVLKNAQNLMVNDLAQELGGRLDVAEATPEAAMAGRTLLLRARVVDVHAGSEAARFWAGFGAGAAWVTMDGEVVDAATQNVLLKFERRRVAATRLIGAGEYQSVLTECVEKIGQDVARMLLAFKTP